MIGRLAHASDPRAAARAAMAELLAEARGDSPVAIVSHFDADGLGAAAVLVRALRAAGRSAEALIVGRGGSAWDDHTHAWLTRQRPAALIVADLGTRAEPVLPGCPTLVIDHHVPTGEPRGAATLSGNGLVPEPTSALLAWWAAGALGDAFDLLWLAAIGLIGDMADERGFPELGEAQRRWGKTALRDATALVNAPRRTAAADPAPALRLLLSGDGPKVITRGESDDAAALRAARAEVREAMVIAKRIAPIVGTEAAVIPLHSGCQIHPLIAQQWRARLRDRIVIAANSGYRDGWVHFAARSATGRDLIAFLAAHRPPGADDRYGNGHVQATGGALPIPAWNAFAASIGIPSAQVTA